MARAFVIGNIAVDSIFRVDALPQPGASILGQRVPPDLGGKGANKAVLLARAGVATTLVTGIGRDPEADRIRALLAGEPLDARLVEIPGAPSDVSVVLAEPDGTNVIVTSNACARALPLSACTEALAAARPGDAVLMQGNTAPDTTRALLELCAARGLRGVFNPSPFDPAHAALLDRVHTLVLNAGEAQALTGTAGAEAAARLLSRGVAAVVLTLGTDGALCATADGLARVPARRAAAQDTTGAGDTFEAVAVASGLRRGAWMDARALADGAAAAAVTVARPGTLASFPSAAELARLMA